jgi:hypothetical protein
MSKVKKGVVAAVAATGLVSAIAAPALAATGRLILSDDGGRQVLINNPQAGCTRVGTGFTRVANDTDAPITVYNGMWCDGWPSLVVPPGTEVFVGARHSFSAPW